MSMSTSCNCQYMQSAHQKHLPLLGHEVRRVFPFLNHAVELLVRHHHVRLLLGLLSPLALLVSPAGGEARRRGGLLPHLEVFLGLALGVLALLLLLA